MNFFRRWGIFLSWIIAVISTLVSLYYSEILNFKPCELCWYQRICIFPMVVILGIAAYKQDRHVIIYALPLMVIGAVFALYQSILMQLGIESFLCGLDCIESRIKLFKYIDFSIISFIGFVVMFLLLFFSRKKPVR